MPDDRDADYVFRPPLQVGQNDLVTVYGSDAILLKSASRDMYTFLHNIVALSPQLGNVGFGDEGASAWSPFVLHWEQEEILCPRSLLSKLGAHKELLDSICEENLPAVLAPCFGTNAHAVFHAGKGKLNPVPIFAVVQPQPTYITGFVAGIIIT